MCEYTIQDILCEECKEKIAEVTEHIKCNKVGEEEDWGACGTQDKWTVPEKKEGLCDDCEEDKLEREEEERNTQK